MAKIRIIANTVTILLLLLIFISCKKDTDIKDDNGIDSGNAGQTSNEAAELIEPEQIISDLPDMNFESKVWKALGIYDATYEQFVNFEIYAETITGELVNDAVYNRNQRILDKYNVIIEQDLLENPQNVLIKSINANEDAYDLAFIQLRNIGAIGTTGYFYNLNTLKYLDFEKPWWSQEVNKSLSVNNKLYFTTSDFNMMDKNRAYLLIYNKKMAEAYTLGNLYNLVYDGKWTVNKMTEICKIVSRDLDGDGVMNDKDQWGLGMDSYNPFGALYNSCDNYIITKDADDNPILSVSNERTITSIDKILLLTNNEDISYYNQRFQGKVADYIMMPAILFGEEQQLFITSFTHGLKYFTQTSDVDFGVLPFPKFDEIQENYVSFPDPFGSALFTIPISVQDVDFAAFVLEALSAESKYDVLPYYYEVSAKTKYTFDEESPKMLDLIFSGMRYDLGIIYNWGGIGDFIRDTIPRAGVNNFVSNYASMETRVLTAIEKTVDLFKDLP